MTKKLKLTEVELSAILGEAEVRAVRCANACECPGQVVSSLSPDAVVRGGVITAGSTVRGSQVSSATREWSNRYGWRTASTARQALEWMRRADLVQSATAARREARS